MGFKFSSAGPHPPTYCATRDIFRFNLKVAPTPPPPATTLLCPHVGTQRITYLLQWNNIGIEGVFQSIMKLQLIRLTTLTTSIRKQLEQATFLGISTKLFLPSKNIDLYCQELMETVKSQINNRYILCLKFLSIKMSDTFLL